MISIFAVLQIVLLGSAIKTYYGTERKQGDLLTLGTRFGVIVLIAVLFAQIIPSSSFLDMEHIEASGLTRFAPSTQRRPNTPRGIRREVLPRTSKNWDLPPAQL